MICSFIDQSSLPAAVSSSLSTVVAAAAVDFDSMSTNGQWHSTSSFFGLDHQLPVDTSCNISTSRRSWYPTSSPSVYPYFRFGCNSPAVDCNNMRSCSWMPTASVRHHLKEEESRTGPSVVLSAAGQPAFIDYESLLPVSGTANNRTDDVDNDDKERRSCCVMDSTEQGHQTPDVNWLPSTYVDMKLTQQQDEDIDLFSRRVTCSRNDTTKYGALITSGNVTYIFQTRQDHHHHYNYYYLWLFCRHHNT